MATNELNKKTKSILTRELESIRDSLAIPTQIPLLQDIVAENNLSPVSTSTPTSRKRKPREKPVDDREITNLAKATASGFKLDKAALKKIRTASDKIIDELVKDYSRQMTALLRTELNAQLETIMKDIEGGSARKSIK